MKRKIVLIGIPSDLGVDIDGARFAPDEIRKILIPRLEEEGVDFIDLGNVRIPEGKCFDKENKLKNIEKIFEVYDDCPEIFDKVFEGEYFPVVLGGDHSVSFGSVREIAKNRKVGLIWIDAHGDFNSEETTVSGNVHGIVLNSITGGSLKDYLEHEKPLVEEKNVAIVGVRDLDKEERVLLEKSDVLRISKREVDSDLKGSIEKTVARVSDEVDGYYVSVDIDVLDPKEFKGVSVPVEDGIKIEQLYKIIDLVNSDKLLGIDFVEFNPEKGDKERGVEIIVNCILRLCR